MQSRHSAAHEPQAFTAPCAEVVLPQTRATQVHGRPKAVQDFKHCTGHLGSTDVAQELLSDKSRSVVPRLLRYQWYLEQHLVF